MSAVDAGLSSSLEQVIRVGASVRRFDYLEEGAGDTEKGYLPGLSLGYLLAPADGSWFVSLDAEGLNGYTTYGGSSLDRSILVSKATPDELIDLELDAGMTLLRPDRDTRISIYTGVGYHFWRRGDGADVGGVGFFREDYAWWVLPFGLRLERDLGPRVTLALDAEGRMSFAGSLKAYLSQLSPEWADAKVGLGGEPGCRVSLPAEIRVSLPVSLIVSPWFEYSAIGASDPFEVRLTNGTGSGVYRNEPSSRTFQYGATASVALSM